MNNINSKKYTFHVQGMHCNSCVLLIESALQNYQGVDRVRASLKNNSVEVEGDFGDNTEQEVADLLATPIQNNGYKLSLGKNVVNIKWSEFKIAIPVALFFVLIFIALQKMGIINLVSGDNVTFGTAFVIGIIASLSTCMAVVGGLLLSMSATFAKDGDKIKPQILFHVGRLVSFFVLGGVIGMIGSAFTLNITGTFILNVVIGVVMLILGINLLDVFHWSKKLQPSMPKFIAKHAHDISKLNHFLTPLLVGIATFFLPCGFTQSMQLYTLSTGNFLDGAMTMFVFALGTLPVLAMISFSSFSIKNSSKSGVFFKSAGLIVILFALFNLLNSLSAIGIIPPLFNI
jgi:sulfite exporter TauE/SafE/copper chaperone CopZ